MIKNIKHVDNDFKTLIQYKKVHDTLYLQNNKYPKHITMFDETYAIISTLDCDEAVYERRMNDMLDCPICGTVVDYASGGNYDYE